MPNHVENIVTLSGDEREIRRMLERIKSDELGVGTVISIRSSHAGEPQHRSRQPYRQD